MSQEYLEEGFDFHSLRIADLRRILTENNIPYPSSAKKKDLLNIYNEFFVPLIPELRQKFNIAESHHDVEMIIDDSSSEDESTGSQRKRKLVEVETTEEAISSPNRSGSISSVSSIEEETIKKLRRNANLPATPNRKKTKLDNNDSKKDGPPTPILSKLANKKPTESPTKNTTSISHFDISNSSSSEDEAQNVKEEGQPHQDNSSPMRSTKKNKKPSFDFSYKRRNLAPDLTTLKVSPQFAEQLQKAVNTKDSLGTSEEIKNDVSTFDIDPQSSIIKEQSFDDKLNVSEPLSVTEPQDYGFNHIEAEKVESNQMNRVIPQNHNISGNELIVTPDLPTEQDVLDSEQLVKDVADDINNNSNKDNDNDVSSQREDTTWLTNSVKRNDPVDVIDLSDSDSEPELKPENQTHQDNVNNNNVVDADEVVEEQLEKDENIKNDEPNLITERVTDSTTTSPLKKRSLFKSIFKSLLKFIVWAYFAILIAFCLWYYQNKIYVGYCGQQKHFPSFTEKYPDFQLSSNIDSILQDYKPSCIPCPENAICFPYMKLKCKPEYKVEKASYDVFGLYPFNNRCVKDDKRKELINEVVAKSLDFLRLRNAQLDCGESHDDVKSGINEDDLFNIFQESKNSSLDDEEFEDIWEQVVEILNEQPDIIYRQIPNNGDRSSSDTPKYLSSNDIQREERRFQQKNRKSQDGFFRSTSKKYITLRCRFEQEIYGTYRRFKYFIWGFIIISLTLKYIQISLQNYYSRRARVKSLTEKVVETLKKRKQDGGDTAYLSAVQLRDVLMSDESNLKLRNNLWKKVTKNVENNNSNIKSSLLEVHGDMMRCWEWIGHIEEDEKVNSSGR